VAFPGTATTRNVVVPPEGCPLDALAARLSPQRFPKAAPAYKQGRLSGSVFYSFRTIKDILKTRKTGSMNDDKPPSAAAGKVKKPSKRKYEKPP